MNRNTPELSVELEAIGPVQAQALLGKNFSNRTLKSINVKDLTRQMQAGSWTPSNDAICIAPDGKLLNGQHRMHAIVASGKTFDMVVMRNMPESSQKNMDTQSRRSAGDALQLEGVTKSHHLHVAATAKMMVLIDSGRFYLTGHEQGVSNSEIVEYVSTNRDIIYSASSTFSLAAKMPCPNSAVAVAHYLISREAGADLADHYMKQIVTPIGESEGSAVHAVSSRLRAISIQGKRYDRRHLVALLLRGWNKYAADIPVNVLQVKIPSKPGTFRLPEANPWTRPPLSS